MFTAECVQTFNQAPGFIETVSVHKKGYRSCEYHIRAPQDCAIILNITSFSGFTSSYSSVNCEPPRLSITEKTKSGSEVVMDLLCPGDHTFPKVYHSTSHHIKLTYVWLPNYTSGFNLHFYFHKNITIIPSSLPATSSLSGMNSFYYSLSKYLYVGYMYQYIDYCRKVLKLLLLLQPLQTNFV